MKKLVTDATRVEEIRRELLTLRPGSSAVDRVLAPLTELLDTEVVLAYSVRDAGAHLELERWNAPPQLAAARTRLACALRRPDETPIILYDFLRPAPEQRNRFVDAPAWIERRQPGGWQSSRMCREVMGPLGLTHHRQYRALICDGPALLG